MSAAHQPGWRLTGKSFRPPQGPCLIRQSGVLCLLMLSLVLPSVAGVDTRDVDLSTIAAKRMNEGRYKFSALHERTPIPERPVYNFVNDGIELNIISDNFVAHSRSQQIRMVGSICASDIAGHTLNCRQPGKAHFVGGQDCWGFPVVADFQPEESFAVDGDDLIRLIPFVLATDRNIGTLHANQRSTTLPRIVGEPASFSPKKKGRDHQSASGNTQNQRIERHWVLAGALPHPLTPGFGYLAIGALAAGVLVGFVLKFFFDPGGPESDPYQAKNKSQSKPDADI
jgi:hypothetical protein